MIDRQTLPQEEKDFIMNPIPDQNLLLYRMLIKQNDLINQVLAKVGMPIMPEIITDPEVIVLQQKIQTVIADKQKEELQKSLDTLTADVTPTVIEAEQI